MVVKYHQSYWSNQISAIKCIGAVIVYANHLGTALLLIITSGAIFYDFPVNINHAAAVLFMLSGMVTCIGWYDDVCFGEAGCANYLYVS